MTNRTKPWELEDWDKIENFAVIDNEPSRQKAQTMSAKKIVYAIVNLQETVLSHQKKTADGMSKLSTSIDSFNLQSGKLAKGANLLAGALVFLGAAQVAVAILR